MFQPPTPISLAEKKKELLQSCQENLFLLNKATLSFFANRPNLAKKTLEFIAQYLKTADVNDSNCATNLDLASELISNYNRPTSDFYDFAKRNIAPLLNASDDSLNAKNDFVKGLGQVIDEEWEIWAAAFPEKGIINAASSEPMSAAMLIGLIAGNGLLVAKEGVNCKSLSFFATSIYLSIFSGPIADELSYAFGNNREEEVQNLATQRLSIW